MYTRVARSEGIVASARESIMTESIIGSIDDDIDCISWLYKSEKTELKTGTGQLPLDINELKDCWGLSVSFLRIFVRFYSYLQKRVPVHFCIACKS